MDEINTGEDLASTQNSTGVIDHMCDYNGIHLLNTGEEADVTSIEPINVTNNITMNDDENLSINIMHHFYHQIIMKMYLPDQNMIKQNEDYVVIKTLFWVYY